MYKPTYKKPLWEKVVQILLNIVCKVIGHKWESHGCARRAQFGGSIPSLQSIQVLKA